ncbi:MAG: nicotinate-nucleotide adenylyltransferase [Gammaproteobacteria bacterium]|nr:nicotinate-nucleotide adenylyltransferase [Gammaproteobacteria bacterium]
MIGVFGGTFNPVHKGHLSLASEVLTAFALESIQFLPCYQSVHRGQPEVSAEIRQQMVDLAIQPYPAFSLNRYEIERKGPSYTVDTLRHLKNQASSVPVCWLMGADSFNSFLSWKQPQEILRLAHLIVCTRPDVALDVDLLSEHYLAQGETLAGSAFGKIAFFGMPPNTCSSTLIRQQLRQGLRPSDCLPLAVLKFIQQQPLYRT